MEHSIGTPTNATPHAPLDPPSAATQAGAATQARAARQARADWLITELGRLAAQAEDPNDRVRIRRTADSLTRLAAAFRP
ncbi:hypothetical protein EV649_5459 [Kribbella sp. VKM Ac-2569]|uniref:hypothetical protein n=1 Tax=Kribbella sp. VKM Ac-2569 TaxID=2512220 RepID=UPI00102CAB0D|nr:hypothetical protein [Kribbella sp. VKM Ac-2569]RZT14684.1 hypothetical protein EV649_5459 [Kribbella sp. VKM Ac-2569]